ncbi:hypothetical protein C7271_12920, partial [filamentous cyanobacterium CCP5]
ASGLVRLGDRDGTLLQQTDYNDLSAAPKEVPGRVISVQFSPDGQAVAIVGSSGAVKLWTPSQQRLETLGRHEGTIHQATFSGDGATLATASEDRTVKLWSLHPKPGEDFLQYTLRGHDDPVHRVAFGPGDRIVATAGADNAVRLWSREKGTLLDVLEGHGDEILSLAFAPPSASLDQPGRSPTAILASSSKDGTIRLWNIDSPVQPLPHENRVFDVTYRPDGQVIASSGVDTIRLWRPDAKLRSHLYAGPRNVLDIDYSPNSELLAAATNTGQIQLWRPDINTDSPYRTVLAHTTDSGGVNQGALAVEFSPDGNWLISGGADYTVKRWAISDLLDWNPQDLAQSPPKPRQTIAAAGIVTSLALSHNGRWLAFGTKATASAEGQVEIWPLFDDRRGSPQPLLRLNAEQGGHSDHVLAVAVNPVSGQIATGGSDQMVKLWSPQGKLMATLREHTEPVTKISFSTDGQFLATASQDGYVRLWTAKGELISSLDGHSREIASVEFDPNGGEILASAGFDNRVLLWRLWDLPQRPYRLTPQPVDILSTLLTMGCQSAGDYLRNYPVGDAAKAELNHSEREKVKEIEEIQDFCSQFMQ